MNQYSLDTLLEFSDSVQAPSFWTFLKHHAERFPKDSCTEMLLNNFYIDNLCKTSNSIEELISLYTKAVLYSHMQIHAERISTTQR